MLKANSYSLIVGMGATGVSVADFLRAKGMAFALYDSQENSASEAALREAFPDVFIQFGGDADELFANAKELILSPGVPLSTPLVADAIKAGKAVLGDIELFFKEVTRPVIGITGSNGKSTLTTLVRLALEDAGYRVGMGGNIGIPALELLKGEADVYVLELSSFQLDTTQWCNLEVACLLNVSEDHMDRYPTFDHYVESKHKIFKGANKVVFNTDDANTYPRDGVVMNQMGFGINERVEKPHARYYLDEKEGYIKFDNRAIMHREEILMPGIHNVANALALFAIGKQFGLSEHNCVEALTSFSGLSHRCQLVGVNSGVTYINDSKATNVGASLAAIQGLKDDYEGLTLIAGGVGKGADFTELGQEINHSVDHLVLIGRDAGHINSYVKDDMSILHASSMRDAVHKAQIVSKRGSVVLLSPACASFDMFKSFEDRGQQFIDAVGEL